jgi:hypothetical protein
MKFYQVNQKGTFEREFNGEYICCPNGNAGNWPLMKDLRKGDILFHYNSTRGAVLGISRVIDIGQHKGVASKNPFVIPGTQCIQYLGVHLSDPDLTSSQRENNRKRYPSYLEVHTAQLYKKNLGKLLPISHQAYLEWIGDTAARSFLADRRIRLDLS